MTTTPAGPGSYDTPGQPLHAAAPYYAPPGVYQPPKDLTALGILAFASASLVTLFAVVDATLVRRAVRSGGVPEVGETADWAFYAFSLGTILGVLSLALAFVTGSMWLHRARRNAELLAPGYPFTRSAGWAWGGWVCPIVSFWFPFQVVRDVHGATRTRAGNELIGWWWACFLGLAIGRRISSNVEADAVQAGTGAAGAQEASVLVALVALVALALWGAVLRRITLEQHARMYGG